MHARLKSFCKSSYKLLLWLLTLIKMFVNMFMVQYICNTILYIENLINLIYIYIKKLLCCKTLCHTLTLNFAVPTFLANKFCCGRVCCEVLAHIYTHMKNIITSLRLFPRHFFSIFHFPIFHYIIYAKHVSTLLQAHVSHTCVNQRSQQFIIWRVCRNL